jgi:hypothetical protein
MQAHIHHENIVRTAAWLPVILACVERAVRAVGRERSRWLVASGTSLGFASVGLHPQILVADILALGAYGVLRGWAGQGSVRGLALAVRVQGVVICTAALGLSLAAVQLVPLAELARLSARAGSFPYTEVAGQSLTPHGLSQLVLPFVFRDAELRQWGLWTHWESYLYVGLAPLLLVLVALTGARRREVALWVILGAAGLLLALGQYAPFDVFALLRNTPGLGWLRAPGRFSLVVDLALAMLAAHGLAFLRARAARPAPRRLSLLTAGVLLLLPVGLSVAVAVVRGALLAEPDAAKRLIDAQYLSLPRDSRWMTAADVYGGMLWSTSPENPRTAGAMLGLLSVAIALIVWQATPWRRVRRWPGWPALLVVSAAVDLLIFSWSIHPREALSAVATPHPAALAVRELLDTLDPSEGPARVLASPLLQQVASDRLAPLGLQDAGGYSSLEPSRHRAYLRRVRHVDDDLLDLWNVRYVLDPAQYGSLASFGDVHYLPATALVRAAARSELGQETLRIPAGFQPAEIRFVSALTAAGSVPQGQAVAVLTLRSDTGQVVAQGLLHAGRDTMDWGWDDLAPWGGARHARVQVAGEAQEQLATGQMVRRLLSFGRLVLEQPVAARTLEFRNLTAHAELVIHGAALIDHEGRVEQLYGRRHKTKYREVFHADGIVVLENSAVFPRAFVVQSSRLAPDGHSLEAMQRLALAPHEEVVLAEDTPPADTRQSPAGMPGRPAPPAPGTARIDHYAPNEVTVQVATPYQSFLVFSDAFYPGWRAYVDGLERPILRGNMLFRVVQVPEGSHEVVFRFEPLSVLLGLTISLTAVTIALGVLATNIRAPRRPDCED